MRARIGVALLVLVVVLAAGCTTTGGAAPAGGSSSADSAPVWPQPYAIGLAPSPSFTDTTDGWRLVQQWESTTRRP